MTTGAAITLGELTAHEDDIASMAVDWADPATGRLDWDDFLGRVERYLDITLPEQMDDPVIRRVQRISRAAVREAQS